MGHRVCPWWLGYFLISPLRRLQLNAEKLLSPLVREGMTVLEPGPGMGFFTVPLARLVGSRGRVVAVDVQPKMIRKLKRRVAKAGLEPRVDVRLVAADSMGVSDLRGTVDFILAFAVVHEMPSPGPFFAQASAAAKAGARLLLVEPAGPRQRHGVRSGVARCRPGRVPSIGASSHTRQPSGSAAKELIAGKQIFAS